MDEAIESIVKKEQISETYLFNDLRQMINSDAELSKDARDWFATTAISRDLYRNSCLEQFDTYLEHIKILNEKTGGKYQESIMDITLALLDEYNAKTAGDKKPKPQPCIQNNHQTDSQEPSSL